VPDVDPFDGGTEARLLLLLETPGPGSAPLRFVSRDNPTGTAANIRRFFGEAGIDRADSVIWNAVPWVIHAPGARNRTPRRGEVAAGLAELPAFLALLPRLTVAVLAGRVAAEARLVIAAVRPGLPAIEMPHPSPTIVCTSPAIPARIRAALAEASALLAGP
jgi:uracil-DNA glycosylase